MAPKRKTLFYRGVNLASDIGGVFSAICMGIISIIVAYEVFMRYVLRAPTTWVQEVSIYLCMAVGLLGAAFALKNNHHFSITILVDRLSVQNAWRIKLLTNLMGIIYSSIFVFKGSQMAQFSYVMKDVSNGVMAIPLWIPWLLVPLGGILLTLQFINKLSDLIFCREPEKNEGPI